MTVTVRLFNYGDNVSLGSFTINHPVSYNVGDYFIDRDTFDNYEDHMYIIRAVTHLKPSVLMVSEVALHIQKYDPEKSKNTVAEAMDKLMSIVKDKARPQEA